MRPEREIPARLTSRGGLVSANRQRPVTLRVDPIRCRAHGLCHEELPELISLDEWGYPVLPQVPVTAPWARRARAAAAACPILALTVRK